MTLVTSVDWAEITLKGPAFDIAGRPDRDKNYQRLRLPP
jgi:hypothetical protein